LIGAVLGVASALALQSGRVPVGFRGVASEGRFEEREPVPVAAYVPSSGKRVACFITINSVEEKGVFTSYLNPVEWDLVELVGAIPGAPNAGWIDGACRSGVRCDIEVISGHFAGGFFGKSGFTLSLDELESHSCAADCPGILRNPREVYLFGCNTLAGKERDSRTPEQYYDVLIADRIPRDQAIRIVEDRYSSFGADNRAKIQRAFAGVPYLYGFHSKGPLGAAIEPILHKYFRNLGDYTAHFDSIAREGKDATSAPNAAIGDLLKKSNFYQAPGLDPKGGDYAAGEEVCRMNDRKLPIAKRVDVAAELLASEREIAILPSVETFFRRNHYEIREGASDRLAGIAALKQSRDRLLEAIRTTFLFDTKLKWIRFARMVGWLDEPAMVDRLREIVEKKFAETPLDARIHEAVCGISYWNFGAMDFSGLAATMNAVHWTSASAAKAMACTGLARYPGFRKSLLERLSALPAIDSGTANLVAIALSGAPRVGAAEMARDPDWKSLLARLSDACESGADPAFCIPALARVGAEDDGARELALRILASAPAARKASSAEAMAVFADPAGGIESAFAELTVSLPVAFSYSAERYFETRPARGAANQARLWSFLTDPSRAPRKITGLLQALRETKLDPAAVLGVYRSARAGGLVETGERTLVALLRIGSRDPAGEPLLKEAFATNRNATMVSDLATKELFETLADPALRKHLRSDKDSLAALCEILERSTRVHAYDSFGETVPRRTPLRGCRDFL
jgi:hypothetical protein